MQLVKKNLISGVEAEGKFLRLKISEAHLAELNSILSRPDVTYGDIKAVLKTFKMSRNLD
jgi:hypothetical protein